jgi:hypothetical protein
MYVNHRGRQKIRSILTKPAKASVTSLWRTLWANQRGGQEYGKQEDSLGMGWAPIVTTWKQDHDGRCASHQPKFQSRFLDQVSPTL